MRQHIPQLLTKTQNGQCERHKRTHREVNYNARDLGVVNDAKKQNKLTQEFSGSYRVLQKISSLSYELEMYKYGELKPDVIHVERIKKYNTGS